MKIAVIAASIIPSTTANSIQVMKTAHSLAEIGHNITLIIPGEKSIEWSGLADWYGLTKPFEIIWLKENLRFHRYDFAFKSIRKAKDLQVDVIYTWMLQTATLSVWNKIPTIIELHDRITGIFAPYLFRYFLKSKTQKRILTNTEALRKAVEEAFDEKFPDTLCQIAPNGIELERYKNLPDPVKARAELNLPKRVTVGYSGHFYEGRGIQVLLYLAKSFPDVNFLWVGGKEEAVQDWKKRLTENDVHNVVMTGFVPNTKIALYQAACEILLMPYEYSIAGSSGGNSADICSPMKMFEYMAAGRAIISSDLSVLHEVLNESNAIFCEAENLVAWENALANLLGDSERQKNLGAQALNDAQAYSWTERVRRALEGFHK
ncbi:MAG: glycosyltransferase [Anaerolineaceae bacterium]|nr:glycosyltransferase [Anaerolineaceae bacterium]